MRNLIVAVVERTPAQPKFEGWPIFRFADGSFVALEISYGQRGSNRDEILISEERPNLEAQVALGYLTYEEAVVIDKQRLAENRAEQAAAQAARDRAEYERLKAKFEGEGK